MREQNDAMLPSRCTTKWSMFEGSSVAKRQCFASIEWNQMRSLPVRRVSSSKWPWVRVASALQLRATRGSPAAERSKAVHAHA